MVTGRTQPTRPGSVVVAALPSPVVVVIVVIVVATVPPILVESQDVQALVAIAEEEQWRAAPALEPVGNGAPEVATALVDEEAPLDEAPPPAELDHARPGIVVRDVRQ